MQRIKNIFLGIVVEIFFTVALMAAAFVVGLVFFIFLTIKLMILRPQFEDFKIIGYYLGNIIIGIALLMFIPAAISLFSGEFNPFLDFLISLFFSLIIGLSLNIFCHTAKEPKWSHGMIVVSLAWVVASSIGAIPLFLSGHFNSYLDAYFEAMSGFTTTGLSLANDLAHMSYGHNFWRHLIIFIGGQGIVVVILTFLVRTSSGAFRLYVGEARDEKVLPNVRQTARFIWSVSFVYLILGSLALAIVGFGEGMSFLRALFHGVCVFMTAFDTGGFTPQSQSIMYYHSLPFEMITIVIMVWGTFNFRLHYILWAGRFSEIRKDFETLAFFTSVILIYCLVALGLSKLASYPDTVSLFREGFYQIISAHTGTGFQTIYSTQFINEWGSLAMLGAILAMSLGGAVCSTTGGIKMLRMGTVVKTFFNEVRQYVSPESAILFEKIYHFKLMFLTDKQMRSACLIVLAYITTFFIGGVAGMVCGYPFVESFFESTSATGNVGLSCGITSPGMPNFLKLTYIFQMWAGRLEFISIFALIGFVWSMVKGR